MRSRVRRLRIQLISPLLVLVLVDDLVVSIVVLLTALVCAALSALTVETLTPIEAMNELYKLKKMLD